MLGLAACSAASSGVSGKPLSNWRERPWSSDMCMRPRHSVEASLRVHTFLHASSSVINRIIHFDFPPHAPVVSSMNRQQVQPAERNIAVCCRIFRGSVFFASFPGRTSAILAEYSRGCKTEKSTARAAHCPDQKSRHKPINL